jgi:hypothetical protein
MNANIRKLALDFGQSWMWPLAILTALTCDFAFLLHPAFSAIFTGGMLLTLQGTFSAPKVALWRALPVTDREIGRARWWQMIGIPGVAILALMALAIALHVLAGSMGWIRHAALPDTTTLLQGVLGQFFYPVFMTIFTLATAFARTTRSPLAVVAMIAIWIPFLAVFPLPNVTPLSLETRALWLGSGGLLIGAVLYVTAPYWPQPIVQPLQLTIGGNNGRAAMSGRAGQSGWANLCGMALVPPVLALSAIMAFWFVVVLALNLHRMVAIQVYQFVPFVVILQMTRFNDAILRLLRSLPGSALQLTAYLFFLPLALLAAVISSVSLLLMPWLTGNAPQLDVVAIAAALLVSAPVLPAALGLRQMAMSFAVSLPMVLVPLIRFGWDYLPAPWQDEKLLLAATAAMILAGFFWMQARISRGMSVYRFQPFIAPRWRGND